MIYINSLLHLYKKTPKAIAMINQSRQVFLLAYKQRLYIMIRRQWKS